MTLLQNIAIFAIGIVAELLIYFVAVAFSEENNQEGQVQGLVLLNTLVIISFLFIWANGLKFPLK